MHLHFEFILVSGKITRLIDTVEFVFMFFIHYYQYVNFG